MNNPGGRVDTGSSSGSIDVRGANADVKANASAGRLTVQGNPSGNSYWELRTVSGSRADRRALKRELSLLCWRRLRPNPRANSHHD